MPGDIDGWVLIETGVPQEGVVALWIDEEGSFHFGARQTDQVLPVIYGDADTVLRPLKGHVAWRCVSIPQGDELPSLWVVLSSNKPPQGQEVMWLDWDGGLHLARRKGRHIAPAVYGNAKDVLLPVGQFRAFQEITQPADLGFGHRI